MSESREFSITVGGKNYKIGARSPEELERAVSIIKDKQAQEQGPGLTNWAAIPELALSGITGGAAQVAAGYKGLYDIMAGEGLDAAAKNVEETQAGLTYAPRSEAAQQILSTVGGVLNKYSDVVDRFGESVAAGTSSPALGAGVRIAGEFAPSMIPGGSLRKGVKDVGKAAISRDLSGVGKGIGEAARALNVFSGVPRDAYTGLSKQKAIKNEMKKAGIDIKSPVANQALQFALKAKELADNQEIYNQRLTSLVSSAKKLQENAKKKGDRLYQSAREKKAAIPHDMYQDFLDDVNSYIMEGGFVLEDSPRLSTIIKSLDQIKTRSTEKGGVKRVYGMPVETLPDKLKPVPMGGPGGLVSLRKRLNQKAKREEGAALGEIKNRLDNLFMDAYDNQMLLGDSSIVPSIYGANDFWKKYVNTFDEDKVVRKMLRNREVTPEEAGKWLLGTGNKFPEGSTRVMNRMEEIFGKDSPQMKALSTEITYRVLQPWFQGNDLRAFDAGVDNLLVKNPTLAQKMLPKESIDALRAMKKWSKGYQDAKLSQKDLVDGFENAAAVLITNVSGGGNQLSMGSLQQRVVRNILSAAIGRGPSADTKRLFSEIAGVDLYSPLSSTSTITGPAWLQEAYRVGEEEEKQKILDEMSAKKRLESFQRAFENSPAVPSTRGVPGAEAQGAPAPSMGGAPSPTDQGAPAPGPVNTQSRAMLESLFPEDQLLKGLTPPPQPPNPEIPQEEEAA
jgi:hypothetical protein